MADIENCFKCGQTPDDILMLSCNHDLCLYCAATLYAIQSKQQQGRKSLSCEICQGITDLDGSSITELQKIFLMLNEDQKRPHLFDQSPIDQSKTKVNNHKSVEKNSAKYQKPEGLTSTFQIQNVLQEQNNNSKEYQSRYSISHRAMSKENLDLHVNLSKTIVGKDFCQEHPDEDLYYYCFTCLCSCICPECVIHGQHREHDVKTIKKSYPLIKSYLESAIESNNQILYQAQSYKDDIDKKHNVQNQLISKYKYQIQQEFEILHNVLNDQEKLLIESLSSIPTVMQRYDLYLQHCKQIDQHIKQLNTTIQKQFNNKEETKLLNFYSELSKLSQPKLEPLPSIEEPQTNQIEIIENLGLIRKNIESVTLYIQVQRENSLSNSMTPQLNTSLKKTNQRIEDYTLFQNENLKVVDKKHYGN